MKLPLSLVFAASVSAPAFATTVSMPYLQQKYDGTANGKACEVDFATDFEGSPVRLGVDGIYETTKAGTKALEKADLDVMSRTAFCGGLNVQPYFPQKFRVTGSGYVYDFSDHCYYTTYAYFGADGNLSSVDQGIACDKTSWAIVCEDLVLRKK